MSKQFTKATLNLIGKDEKGKMVLLKSMPNLVENPEDAMIQTIAQAITPLVTRPVTAASVLKQYAHSIN